MRATRLMNNCRPKLVTFDVTGTLLSTTIKEHYYNVGKQHDIQINNPDLLTKSFKRYFKQLSIDHPNFGKHSGLGWKNWWKYLIYNVYNDQSINVTLDKLDEVSDNLIDIYTTDLCWKKYSDTEILLDYLNNKNITIGVISNFDERLEEILISTKLRKYFNFIITSWSHGYEKPNSTIFQEAIKISKNINKFTIKPDEVIHIGDDINNDYNGAKNVGWNSYLINHNNYNNNNIKNINNLHVFNSHNELKKHFEKMLN